MANYTINFVGIVCMVKQADGSYLAALPDGRNYHDPCTKAVISKHLPYLIIPKDKVMSSDVPGVIVNQSFVVDLENVSSLEFPDAMTGSGIDDTGPVQNKAGYLWSEIDSALQIEAANPANTILTVALSSGTLRATRIIIKDATKESAHISELTVTQAVPGTSEIVVDGKRKIAVDSGAAVVVANVAPEWLGNLKNYPDGLEHFNLYYRLGKVAPTTCKMPGVKLPPFTTAANKYLDTDRGIQVACSPTYWP